LSGEKDGIVKCLGAGCPTTLTDDLCDKRFGIYIAANFGVKTKRALKSVNQGEQLGSLPLKVSSKFLNKYPAICLLVQLWVKYFIEAGEGGAV